MKYHCYRNRELSWLSFNQRVLEEADDKNNPLCERMSFASIFQSNLDEFFMVRVGMLHDRVLFSGNPIENKTNMTAKEQIAAILKTSGDLTLARDRVYRKLMNEAKKYNIHLVNFNHLNAKQSAAMEEYFLHEIMPLLSPQVVGKRQPFPFLHNQALYVLVSFETKNNNEKIGIIPCNTGVFHRLIPALGANGTYMLAEELILHYVSKVFINYKIKEKTVLRVIRNADIDTDAVYDDEADYRDLMERIIKKRRKLCPIKLELSRPLDHETLRYLCKKLDLEEDNVFLSSSPLDLSFLFEIEDKLKEHKELFYPQRIPQPSPMVRADDSMIHQIRHRDILLSYPYESMNPFLRLLGEAAHDPSVVSIKMTLYRVAKYSKIIERLIDAAENGKEIVVLVELRARFDEENNIEWSKRLEDAGCRIIYGLDHLKVHSKLCLITRKKNHSVEYITQIGTGNYNEKTARQYTDYCLMTASPDIGIEAAEVLNRLAMGQVVESARHLLVAPKCLQNKLLSKMDLEIEKAKRNEPAFIGAKINSLTDKKIINRLIEASQAGVKVSLIVRGICCLIPGIPGETENITVISIVGRFLEHSRVYIFGAGEDPEVYISSADFMTRNTLHRVEVAAPVYDKAIRSRILAMFSVMMQDNVKARRMKNDATYERINAKGKKRINAQEYFYDEAYRANE